MNEKRTEMLKMSNNLYMNPVMPDLALWEKDTIYRSEMYMHICKKIQYWTRYKQAGFFRDNLK